MARMIIYIGRKGADGLSGSSTADEIITLLAASYPDFAVTLGSDAAGDAPSQATIDALVALGVKEKNVLYADTGADPVGNTFTIAPLDSASTIDGITLSLAGGSFAIAPLDSASTIDNITLISASGNTFTIESLSSTSTIDAITLVLAGGSFAVAPLDSASTIDNIVITEPAAATWDPDNKATNIVLSGGDLIATKSVNGWTSVRSYLSFDAGDDYFEIEAFSGSVGNGAGPALMNASASVETYAGVAGSNGIMYTAIDDKVYFNGVAVASGLGGNSDGTHRITCARQGSTGKIWFGFNSAPNTAGAEHGTMAGPVYASSSIVGSGVTPVTATLKPTIAEWLYTSPWA